MSYILGTDAWLAVVTAPQAFPPPSSPAERIAAAEATRAWSEHVSEELIHISIITYGEIWVIRNGAHKNVALLYQLIGALDELDSESGREQVLALTTEDMTHWANIYNALDDDPGLRLEDSYVLAQALNHGYTYVGQRSDAITRLEDINLSFLDPAEWLAHRGEA